MKEIETEEQSEVEMTKALMEARRAENLIKYKDEIMNRPKRHWMTNTQQKLEIKEKSKDDLVNVKAKFDEELHLQSKIKKKRDQKRDEKSE